MTSGKPSLLDDIGNAASGAGSEALAAISNFGGDTGGTVGRLVSAVFGRHGGFAPKVITAVTKHGIAGIERVEPLAGVDRGYRAVAADANGLESIRTILELDPREYDVTVTREEGAGVVEFVQVPEPDPDPESQPASIEPSPPVTGAESRDPATGAGQHTGSAAGDHAAATPVRTQETRRDEVAEARAEAEKAKAEAEAEKARAEAETARAEAETAKVRARAERERLNAGTELGAGTERGHGSAEATPELDGGTAVAGNGPESPTPTTGASAVTDGTDRERDFGTVEGSRADVGTSTDHTESASSTVERDPSDGKWGLSDDAGGETTVVGDEFGSFVAADPVTDGDAASAAGSTDGDECANGASPDGGIGRWAGEPTDGSGGSEDTGGFEF